LKLKEDIKCLTRVVFKREAGGRSMKVCDLERGRGGSVRS